MRRRAWGRTLVLVAVVSVVACGQESDLTAVSRAPMASVETTTTTAPTTTSTTAPPATTTTTTTTTTTPPPTTTPAPRFTMAPYTGFGVWVDAFDWSSAFTSNPISAADVDVMAAEGAQTLFIQTNRYNHPADTLEPERLQPIIDRAHHHGLRVVGWYLPTLTDPATDLRRLLAIADLNVDGIAVDIEARDVVDVAERNRRLIELSRNLHEHLPNETIGAIVLEPVVMEDVNPNYWPGYPWKELAPYYDVWMPMAYWTNRTGDWRSAYDYIATNISRVRSHLGQPEAAVHPVGGIGDKTTVADLDGMVRATAEGQTIGGSIYDYRTTLPEHWATLRAFRR